MLESRETEAGEAVRRRRECLECRARFTTFERVEQAPLFVVKRDGSRQPFDRGKLLRGLERACVKRPVPLEQVEGLAIEVEAGCGPMARGGPVGADRRGCAARLLDFDGVAYVRFASVYGQFDDVEEFQRALDAWSMPNERLFDRIHVPEPREEAGDGDPGDKVEQRSRAPAGARRS